MTEWEIVGSDAAPDHPEWVHVCAKGAEDGTHLTQEEYDDLRKRLGPDVWRDGLLLDALYAAGVDNWEGFGLAMEIYRGGGGE